MAESKSYRIKLPDLDHILLGIIIIVGAILRFWDYSHLPFSFDEFSALFRTRFNNLSDLFEYGVKTTDTHPPGIQVFLYYWVKFFGESEMVVKFPFVHLGLLAIIMVFKVGRLWFNKTAGLFAAMFLAVLQYPITYSQFARPYISGLFFALLMVWFWTHVVFYPDKKRIQNRTGFIISAALCAYNHHFSLFLAGLAGISGFFFVKKADLKSYLLTCGFIVLLYLPNLPIFFYQLQRGGVEGWLAKPDTEFILDYFGYVLHFSITLYGLTAVIIVFGFVFIARNLRETNKFRILAFSWFTVTYLAGYFYSVYVNAVLQYSVLIFAFPFLVLFFFSFYRDTAYYFKIPVIAVFMAVAIYTLVTNRKHYQVQYQSAFKEILAATDSVRTVNRNKKVTAVLYMPEKIRDYYNRKFGYDAAGIANLESLLNFNDFRKFVRDQQSDLFILGWSYLPKIEYKLIVEEKYPYLLEKKGWFNGEFFVYSREKPDDPGYTFADSILFTSLNTFDTLTTGWEDVVLSYQLTPGVNYKEDKILRFNKEFGYSPKFNTRLDKIINSKSNEIIISLNAYIPVSMVNPVIVCEFRSNNRILDWRSSNISDFMDAPLKELPVYLAIRRADLKLEDDDIEIWVYFWNKDLGEIYIDEFKVEVREGNPLFYALYKKL
ncbi:MAG: hypothetical protein FJY07_04985 [Bacteroidetes bacterium]|nr:hypothetical protein [Bacteroidota bacterium]